MKYTSVKFLKYVTGSTLEDTVKIENKDVGRGSDYEVRWPAKLDIKIKSDRLF